MMPEWDALVDLREEDPKRPSVLEDRKCAEGVEEVPGDVTDDVVAWEPLVHGEG